MNKYTYMVFLFLICASSLGASSGDGIQFRINDFKLTVTWPDSPNAVNWGRNDTIEIIEFLNGNYDTLYAISSHIEFDLDQDEKNIHVQQHIIQKEHPVSREIVFPKSSDISDEIIKIMKNPYRLKDSAEHYIDVYVVFIKTDYMMPDSRFRTEVDEFLRKSELHLTHPMALQSNYQGYVYSMFFRREAMYAALGKLDVPRYIVNRKRVNEDKYDAMSIMIN